MKQLKAAIGATLPLALGIAMLGVTTEIASAACQQPKSAAPLR